MHTTNYFEAFIAVAEDCPATIGEVPPERDPKSVARIQYEMLVDDPYRYTSDDVVYTSSGARQGLSREEFFAKGQPCLRASPLAKRYGWGVHSDGAGRVAIYPVGSPEYAQHVADPDLEQRRAMRARR